MENHITNITVYFPNGTRDTYRVDGEEIVLIEIESSLHKIIKIHTHRSVTTFVGMPFDYQKEKI